MKIGFKPCYKWITFNTEVRVAYLKAHRVQSFKPCYKWITFNTLKMSLNLYFKSNKF